MDSRDDECLPIKTLDELWNYTEPLWATQTVKLSQSSNWCIAGTDAFCHQLIEEWKPKPRYTRNSVPRTLVCHDMKGGYKQDRFVNGSTDETAYTFYHWAVIDTFIYFSHNFITIPPLGWINTAHRHGVQILGTIITEWKEGRKILHDILENQETISKFVDAIIKITDIFHLDGWFLNIENEVGNVAGLRKLVCLLSDALHRTNEKSVLIWYDSVVASGKLKWQNELNDHNKDWFDLCDGIFLNYTWEAKNLLKTLHAAGPRSLDVYVGVDVFSRNCIGGMHSAHSVQIIRSMGLSVALFAPGWTHETLPEMPPVKFRISFEARDMVFWKSLLPFLYEHGLCEPFFSIFDKGVSKGRFNLMQQCLPINCTLYGEPWEETNSCTSIDNETSNKLRPPCQCLQFGESRGALENSCSIKISNTRLSGETVHRLISCDIFWKEVLVVLLAPKQLLMTETFNILLMLQLPNGSYKKVVLRTTGLSTDISNRSEEHIKCLENIEAEKEMMKPFVDLDKLRIDWEYRFFKLSLREAHILEIVARISGTAVVEFGGMGVIPYPIETMGSDNFYSQRKNLSKYCII